MPKFARKDVRIKPERGAVEVEVICGFAQHIRFVAELFDDQGNNPQTVNTGSSLGTDPPPFHLNLIPSQLSGRFLMITADVFHLGITDKFQVDVVFRQANEEIDRMMLDGTFTDNVSISFVARFQ